MQIVIEIPETYYDYCRKLEDAIEIELAIKNGVILPEHHGRLIDADKLLKDCFYETEMDLGKAPTVLEGSD